MDDYMRMLSRDMESQLLDAMLWGDEEEQEVFARYLDQVDSGEVIEAACTEQESGEVSP